MQNKNNLKNFIENILVHFFKKKKKNILFCNQVLEFDKFKKKDYKTIVLLKGVNRITILRFYFYIFLNKYKFKKNFFIILKIKNQIFGRSLIPNYHSNLNFYKLTKFFSHVLDGVFLFLNLKLKIISIIFETRD